MIEIAIIGNCYTSSVDERSNFNLACMFDGCEKPAKNVSKPGYCGGHVSQLNNGKELTPLRSHNPPPPAGDGPSCAYEYCDRQPNSAKGYCTTHYQQQRQGREMKPALKFDRGCAFNGCERAHYSRGFCRTHYAQHCRSVDLHVVGELAPNIYPTGEGYLRYSYTETDGTRRVVLQHRYVMEQMLGRRLTSDESIHHRNGDRADNRPENLELWSKFQPAGQHVADKIRYALELIDKYGSDVTIYE